MTKDGIYCFAYNKFLKHANDIHCPVNNGSGCLRGLTSGLRNVEKIQVARENGVNAQFTVFGKPMNKSDELDYLKRLGANGKIWEK
jgi:hypothetical protein